MRLREQEAVEEAAAVAATAVAASAASSAAPEADDAEEKQHQHSVLDAPETPGLDEPVAEPLRYSGSEMVAGDEVRHVLEQVILSLNSA